MQSYASVIATRAHCKTALDDFSVLILGQNGDLPKDLRGEVRLIRGDVRDARVWESALPGHNAIVRLAAETGTGQSMYEVSRYEQVNLAAMNRELLAKAEG
jgi:dTDP-L-rhamnose 4-epimerase